MDIKARDVAFKAYDEFSKYGVVTQKCPYCNSRLKLIINDYNDHLECECGKMNDSCRGI